MKKKKLEDNPITKFYSFGLGPLMSFLLIVQVLKDLNARAAPAPAPALAAPQTPDNVRKMEGAGYLGLIGLLEVAELI